MAKTRDLSQPARRPAVSIVRVSRRAEEPERIAGGLLSLLLEVREADEETVIGRVKGIGATLADLLQRAAGEGLSPHRVADRIVHERLAAARRAAPLTQWR